MTRYARAGTPRKRAAAVKERCDSQQDSRSTASAEHGAQARSRVVVQRVQGLRAVLDAGPLEALSPEAVGNLRAFATYLAEHLSPTVNSRA
jgi:hypothetical protein